MRRSSLAPDRLEASHWLRQKELQNASLSLAKLGWRVFPVHQPVISNSGIVCGCGKTDCKAGKHPCISNYLKRATTSSEQILKWWDQWPDANIGIVTGRDSGIIVLDIDPRNGGEESLRNLLAENGPLPTTVKAHSGGRGFHFYFRHPGGSIKGADRAFGSEFSGIDLKADGGFVVAPPSFHASGGYYRWADGLEPNSTTLARVPNWLLNRRNSRKKKVTNYNRVSDSSVSQSPVIREGNRNNTLYSFGCGIRGYCHSETEICAHLKLFNETRCDPPLPAPEVKTIASSASRHEGPTPDELLRAVWAAGGPLVAGEKAVLSVLLLRSNWSTWVCFPSQQTIAADAGMGEKTARRYLNSLREKRYISWERTLRSNQYKVHLDRILTHHPDSDSSCSVPSVNTITPPVDSRSYRPTERDQVLAEIHGRDPPDS